METPLELEISGFTASAHLREVIEGHVQRLEKRYGRLTSCRLVIKAPGPHHHMGTPYPVSIQIALPAHRKVNVAPVFDSRDPRQGDIIFAVNDAFHRAAAQLDRHARQLQGQKKRNRGAAIGHAVRIDPGTSCGFLTSEDQREIYFHAHSVLGGRFGKLNIGDRVAYHEEAGLKGPQASTVRLLSGARQ